MNGTHELKSDALSDAIAEAQIDAKDMEAQAVITMCVGKPWCYLSGEDASTEMEKGCILCDHYVVDPDGTWVVEKASGVSYREN